MKKSRKLFALFAVLFMVIFALSCVLISACGNKDDGDDGNTNVPETSEPEGGTGDGGSGTGDGGSGTGDDGGNDGGNVETKDDYKVTVTAEGGATTVAVGGKLQLTASVTCGDTAVNGASVTWLSGDTSAATVSDAGLVTGVAASDSVTVTATYTAGNTSVSGSITIAVVAHEHSYSVKQWNWADDYSTCSVTFVCANTDGLCNAVEVTENASVSSVDSATCGQAGEMTYTASYTGTYGTYSDVKTGAATQATGEHTYGTTPTYDETKGEWIVTCSNCSATETLTSGTGYTFTVTTLNQLSSAVALNGASVVLGARITGNITVKNGAAVTLDLAGYTLSYSGPSAYSGTGTTYDTVYTVVVEEGASLTVKDSSNATETSQMGSIVLNYTVPTNYSAMEYSRRFAAIQTEGTLVIEGGYIKSSSVGIVAEGSETYADDNTTVTGGYVYVSGGYIDAEQYSIFEGAGTNVVVYINGGTVSGGRGICVDGDAYFGYDTVDTDGGTKTRHWQDNAKTTLYVYDGTIMSAGRSAISTLGYANASSTYVYIYGGSITGEDLSTLGENGASLADNTDFATVYIANGNLVVTGGEIKGTYALSVKGGTANISGGTFTSTGAGNYDFGTHSSKPQPYALSVVYYGPQPQGNVAGRSDIDNSLAVTVSGGTFDGDIVFDASLATAEKTAELTIKGGTFTDCPEEYIGTGCSMYNAGEEDDSYYVVVPYVLVQSDASGYYMDDGPNSSYSGSYTFAATQATSEMTVDENGNVTYVFTGTAGRMESLMKTVYEGYGWTIAGTSDEPSRTYGYVVFQIYVEKGWKITSGEGTDQITLIDNEAGDDTYLYVVFGFVGNISAESPMTVTYTVSYEDETESTQTFEINIKLTNITIAAADIPPEGSESESPPAPGSGDDNGDDESGGGSSSGSGSSDDGTPPPPDDDDE